MNQSTNNPISQSEREETLDVLRGFALLGILMVNIQFFGMVHEVLNVYENATISNRTNNTKC